MSAFSGTAWYNNQPDGLVYAGNVAYTYKGEMPSDTHIELLDGTLGVAGNAFRNCSGLTSITIPNSVTSIGQSAFSGCSGLTSITIPNSVTSIGEYAFSDCSNLASITLPNAITAIERGTFFYCKSLKSITIPKSVVSIATRGDGNAFWACTALESIVIEAGNPTYDSRGDCNAIIETSTNTLLYGCKSTIIPNSVTSIGENAFRECSGLTSVNIPESVTCIGEYAFYGCSGLTSVTIPGSVTRLGSYSFYETNISSVEFQHTKEQLDALVWDTKYTDDFKGPNETTLKFSEDVMNKVLIDYFQKRSDGFRANKECFEGIDGAAFYAKVTDGDNVTWTPLNVTLNEENLIVKSPAIDNTTIGALDLSQINTRKDGSGKFYTITKINDDAFSGCKGLTSVIIGDGVTDIGREVFAACSNLTSVIIGEGLTSLSIELFRSCTSLTTVSLPNSLVSIGEEAFWSCTNLEFVALPESVTSIAGYAFDHCNKLTLVLPEQLTNIGKYALHEVKCAVFTSETAPRIVDGNSSEKCVVQQIAVPYNAIDAYSTLFAGLANTTLGAVVGYETTPVSVNFEGTQVNSCKAKFTSYTLQDGVYDSREEESMVYGLDPESSVEYSWTLEDGNRVVYRNITTSALTFETQPAQATSNTKALISAKTNGEDDGLRFGFEWRRYDAPDLVPSNIVDCPVYEGVLAGTLNGLSANTYYKYRPFYKSDAGNVYYGEWMAFGTADTYVYFEPVVHTANAQNVTENSATLSGTAVTGSDDIVEQGFEYWMSQGSSAAARRAPQDVQTIQATGMLMKVVLTGLQPGTTYVYRSYARTDKGTTYGEEKNFVTAGNTPTGINSMYVTEEAHETARYNLQGRRLSAPEKGVNIIRMSDGTTRKVFVK